MSVEALKQAAIGARFARGIDIRVEHPEQAYPYLEIVGASAGQLSTRECEAWARFLRECSPAAIIAALERAERIEAAAAKEGPAHTHVDVAGGGFDPLRCRGCLYDEGFAGGWVASARDRLAASAAPTPTQASLAPSAIADIRCAARSGIGADAKTTLGLLATIDEMGRALATQGARYADELDRLRRLVPEATGQMQAVVESRVPTAPDEIGRRA